MAGASISKEIEFDAGHRVPNHASKCRNPHGHRYRVVMNVSGDLVDVSGDSQEGMVLDFGFMKALLTTFVHDVYDHGFIVYENDNDMLDALGVSEIAGIGNPKSDLCWKVLLFPYVPTAENLAMHFFNILSSEVVEATQGRGWLSSITVWETPTSSATYGNQPR